MTISCTFVYACSQYHYSSTITYSTHHRWIKYTKISHCTKALTSWTKTSYSSIRLTCHQCKFKITRKNQPTKKKSAVTMIMKKKKTNHKMEVRCWWWNFLCSEVIDQKQCDQHTWAFFFQKGNQTQHRRQWFGFATTRAFFQLTWCGEHQLRVSWRTQSGGRDHWRTMRSAALVNLT